MKVVKSSLEVFCQEHVDGVLPVADMVAVCNVLSSDMVTMLDDSVRPSTSE